MIYVLSVKIKKAVWMVFVAAANYTKPLPARAASLYSDIEPKPLVEDPERFYR